MIVFKKIFGRLYITKYCVHPNRLVLFNKKADLEHPENWCLWYSGKKCDSLEYDIYIKAGKT